MSSMHAKEYAAAFSVLSDYLEILEPYVGDEPVRDIKDRWLAGIDVTDELYEKLCEHDEQAAKGWLEDAAKAHHAQ